MRIAIRMMVLRGSPNRFAKASTRANISGGSRTGIGLLKSMGVLFTIRLSHVKKINQLFC
jgi:hypothetical protein